MIVFKKFKYIENFILNNLKTFKKKSDMMKITFINPPQTNSKYKFLGVVAPSLGIG